MASSALSPEDATQLFKTIDSATNLAKSGDESDNLFFSSSTILSEIMTIYIVFLIPGPNPILGSTSIAETLLKNHDLWLTRVIVFLKSETKNLSLLAIKIVSKLASIGKLPVELCEGLVKVFNPIEDDTNLLVEFGTFFSDSWNVTETPISPSKCFDIDQNYVSISVKPDAKQRSEINKLKYTNPAAAKHAMNVWTAVVELFMCSIDYSVQDKQYLHNTSLLFFRWAGWKKWVGFLDDTFENTQYLYCYYTGFPKNPPSKSIGYFVETPQILNGELCSDTIMIEIIEQGLYYFCRMASIIASYCGNSPIILDKTSSNTSDCPKVDDQANYSDSVLPNNMAFTIYFSSYASRILYAIKTIVPPPLVPKKLLSHSQGAAKQKALLLENFRSHIFKSFYFIIACFHVSGVFTYDKTPSNWELIWKDIIRDFIENKCLNNCVPVDGFIDGLTNLISGKVYNGAKRYGKIRNALMHTCYPNENLENILHFFEKFDQTLFQPVKSTYLADFRDDWASGKLASVLRRMVSSESEFYTYTICNINRQLDEQHAQFNKDPSSLKKPCIPQQNVEFFDILGFLVVFNLTLQSYKAKIFKKSIVFEEADYIIFDVISPLTVRNSLIALFKSFHMLESSYFLKIFIHNSKKLTNICSICVDFFIEKMNDMKIFQTLNAFCRTICKMYAKYSSSWNSNNEKQHTKYSVAFCSIDVNVHLTTNEIVKSKDLFLSPDPENSIRFPFGVALFFVLFRSALIDRQCFFLNPNQVYLSNEFHLPLAILLNNVTSHRTILENLSEQGGLNKGLISNFKKSAFGRPEVSRKVNEELCDESDCLDISFFLDLLKNCILPMIVENDKRKIYNLGYNGNVRSIFSDVVKAFMYIDYPWSFSYTDLWSIIWEANRGFEENEFTRAINRYACRRSVNNLISKNTCERYGFLLATYNFFMLRDHSRIIFINQQIANPADSSDHCKQTVTFRNSVFAYLILSKYFKELVGFGILPKLNKSRKKVNYEEEGVRYLLAFSQLINQSKLLNVFSRIINSPQLRIDIAMKAQSFYICQQIIAAFIVFEHIISELMSISKKKCGNGLYLKIGFKNSELGDIHNLILFHELGLKCFKLFPMHFWMAVKNWKKFRQVKTEEYNPYNDLFTKSFGIGTEFKINLAFPLFKVDMDFSFDLLKQTVYYLSSFILRLFISPSPLDAQGMNAVFYAQKIIPSSYISTVVEFLENVLEQVSNSNDEIIFRKNEDFFSIYSRLLCIFINSKILSIRYQLSKEVKNESFNKSSYMKALYLGFIHSSFYGPSISTLCDKKQCDWVEKESSDMIYITDALVSGLASRNFYIASIAAKAMEKMEASRSYGVPMTLLVDDLLSDGELYETTQNGGFNKKIDLPFIPKSLLHYLFKWKKLYPDSFPYAFNLDIMAENQSLFRQQRFWHSVLEYGETFKLSDDNFVVEDTYVDRSNRKTKISDQESIPAFGSYSTLLNNIAPSSKMHMLKIAGRPEKEEDNIESLAASENQYIMRQDDTAHIDGINSTFSSAFTDNGNDSKGLDGEPIQSISKKGISTRDQLRCLELGDELYAINESLLNRFGDLPDFFIPNGIENNNHGNKNVTKDNSSTRRATDIDSDPNETDLPTSDSSGKNGDLENKTLVLGFKDSKESGKPETSTSPSNSEPFQSETFVEKQYFRPVTRSQIHAVQLKRSSPLKKDKKQKVHSPRKNSPVPPLSLPDVQDLKSIQPVISKNSLKRKRIDGESDDINQTIVKETDDVLLINDSDDSDLVETGFQTRKSEASVDWKFKRQKALITDEEVIPWHEDYSTDQEDSKHLDRDTELLSQTNLRRILLDFKKREEGNNMMDGDGCGIDVEDDSATLSENEGDESNPSSKEVEHHTNEDSLRFVDTASPGSSSKSHNTIQTIEPDLEISEKRDEQPFHVQTNSEEDEIVNTKDGENDLCIDETIEQLELQMNQLTDFKSFFKAAKEHLISKFWGR